LKKLKSGKIGEMKTNTIEAQAAEAVRKGMSKEEFVKARSYKSSNNYDYEEIEVEDSMGKIYRDIDSIDDEINKVQRKIYGNDYDSDIYDNFDEAEIDMRQEIKEFEAMKSSFIKEQKKKEKDSIFEWVEKNKLFFGEDYRYIEDAIIENHNTNGSLWRAIIHSNKDELPDLLDRLDISTKRHTTTNYDNIDKRGLSDDEVKELRRDFNEGLKEDNIFDFKTRSQLEAAYDAAKKSMRK
jgi:hypothetical protein